MKRVGLSGPIGFWSARRLFRVLITFFFDHLLPSYYDAERGARYDGRIRPRNIGIKDFWNRLDRSYTFGRRYIPVGGVARRPRSPNMCALRVLPVGRIGSLGVQIC